MGGFYNWLCDILILFSILSINVENLITAKKVTFPMKTIMDIFKSFGLDLEHIA